MSYEDRIEDVIGEHVNAAQAIADGFAEGLYSQAEAQVLMATTIAQAHAAGATVGQAAAVAQAAAKGLEAVAEGALDAGALLDRLLKAVETLFRTAYDPDVDPEQEDPWDKGRIDRIVTEETLDASTRAMLEQGKNTPGVAGWRRVTERDPCQLCVNWQRSTNAWYSGDESGYVDQGGFSAAENNASGYVFPRNARFPRHVSDRCEPELVTIAEASEWAQERLKYLKNPKESKTLDAIVQALSEGAQADVDALLTDKEPA